jgi:serine/threonine protein kinase
LKDTDNTSNLGNKYTLLDLIGTGGMAEVYRAKLIGQRGFEKPLVIKQLLADVVGDDEIVANFIDEARLAALLQHENIACIYDFGEENGSYFIAMEYLFGKDLHNAMAQAKGQSDTVGETLALYIAAQVCAGMDYAHNLTDLQQQPLNIIHRDLTPHNVFLTYEGKVKIIDFGVAKAELFDNRTRAGVVKGKVTYMSPEQLVEGDIDARSDIFSIGILLYEMLSGVRMYQGDTATLIRKCINVEYTPIEEVLPKIDSSVAEILTKALQKEKENRYQSCGEMLDDINDYFFKQGKRPDRKIVKKFLFDLFRSDYDSEIQRLSPGGVGGAMPQSAGALGDGDKTVFVDNPYVGRRAWWFSLFTSNMFWPVFSILASVIVVAYINIALDKSGVVKEVKLQAEEKPAVLLSTIVPKEPAVVVKLVPPPVPLEVTVEVEKEIDDEDIMARAVWIFLEKAEKAFQENKLTLPTENSAYTYYKKVLELDSENEQAEKGIENVAARYATFAEKKISDGDVATAKKRIRTGLGVMATSERLLALQKQIVNTEQAEIDVLLKKAKRAFAESRYTSPAGDCAFLYYKDIEKIRPGSPIVKKGFMAIADRYTSMGDKALQNLNLKKTRVYVASGLKVVPDHPGLLELQADLQKSKPAIFFKGLGRSLRPLFQ